MIFRVYTNSLTNSPFGCVSDRGPQVFEGCEKCTVAYLRALPIGLSVEVRHPKGARSCLNKAKLWGWVLAVAVLAKGVEQ